MASNKTNFQKVQEFHKAFNHPLNKKPQPSLLHDNKLKSLRTALIEEEFKELRDAWENNDFQEVADAIGDILYVVYGAAACLGIDADDVYDRVHTSNMSKLCTSEDEAIKTVDHYHSTTDLRVDFEKSSIDGYWVVFNKDTGKILKSINYKVPDISHYKFNKMRD